MQILWPKIRRRPDAGLRRARAKFPVDNPLGGS
jgi:hypothetical protein